MQDFAAAVLTNWGQCVIIKTVHSRIPRVFNFCSKYIIPQYTGNVNKNSQKTLKYQGFFCFLSKSCYYYSLKTRKKARAGTPFFYQSRLRNARKSPPTPPQTTTRGCGLSSALRGSLSRRRFGHVARRPRHNAPRLVSVLSGFVGLPGRRLSFGRRPPAGSPSPKKRRPTSWIPGGVFSASVFVSQSPLPPFSPPRPLFFPSPLRFTQ